MEGFLKISCLYRIGGLEKHSSMDVKPMSKLKVGMSKLCKFRCLIENHSYMHMKLESCMSPVTSWQVLGVIGGRFSENFMFILIWMLGKT